MLRRVSFVAAFMAVALSVVVLGTMAQSALRAQGSRDEGLAARVQALEAREAVRTLYAEYGRTLDARDFQAFSLLWARDAEYRIGEGARRDRGVPGKGDWDELPRLQGQELTTCTSTSRSTSRAIAAPASARAATSWRRRTTRRRTSCCSRPTAMSTSRKTASGSSGAGRRLARSPCRGRKADNRRCAPCGCC